MIVIYSLIAAGLFVVADAAVDTLIHKNGDFLDLLFNDHQEFYFRLLAIASFLTFGLIIGRIFKERLRIEDELTENRERYSSLVNSTNDSIYVVERNGKYLFMNEIYKKRLGISGDQCEGRYFNEFHSKEALNVFWGIIKKVVAGRVSLDNEIHSERDGNYYLETFSPVKDHHGEVVAITVVSKEITERKQMEERLRVLTITDDMTGLLNRRGFFLVAQKQLKQAEREKRSMYLISADLDNLKVINDSYGHSEGDWVLMEISNILEKCYRESDVIARLGGDEFVLLVNDYPGTNIHTLTERLQEKIDFFNAQSVKPYKLSLSVGIIRYNPEAHTPLDGLLSEVDRVMYRVKAEKKKVHSPVVPAES